jgi:hypothetical protein
MRLVTGVLFLTLLGACSSSSGVIPFGKDTYTLAVSAEGGVARAKRDALVEANQYCADRDLRMMPVQESTSETAGKGLVSDTFGNFDFVFRCLAENDADFDRTKPDRPDIVIENR